MLKTPPVATQGLRSDTRAKMDAFKTLLRKRQALLRQLRKVRQSILVDLGNNGVAEATEILQFQDSPESQPRCPAHDMCPGCRLLMEKGRCMKCVGCTSIRKCVEDRRRCSSWPFLTKPPTFGTSISLASSIYTSMPDYLDRMHGYFDEFEKVSDEQEDALETSLEGPDRDNAIKDPIWARGGSGKTRK